MLDRKIRIASPLAVIALAAGALVGCNGAGSPTAPGGADGVNRVSVMSQTFDAVEAGGVRFVDFSLPHDGTLSVRVAWTDDNNSVIAVLTSAGCADYRHAGEDCQARGLGGASRGKLDREGEVNYAGTAGGYRLWLRNEGPGVESITVSGELSYAVETPVTDPDGGRRGPLPDRSPRTR